MEGCLTCAGIANGAEIPGGVIHATDHWIVDHCFGPLGVGTLIVKPKRHVVHVWELATDEAEELGPLLRRTSEIVAELTDPNQVYVCLWSHADGSPAHIHFVVQPAHPGDLCGPRLQVAMLDRNEPPPRAEVERFAERARLLF